MGVIVGRSSQRGAAMAYGSPMSAYATTMRRAAEPKPGDACPFCGPSYILMLRELARCGRKGPGDGAYCAVCRSVWPVSQEAAPAL